jgi:hypothetical protein
MDRCLFRTDQEFWMVVEETCKNIEQTLGHLILFKPLPAGDHTIEVEVIRQPVQANQPVEHDVAKWNIKVVP